MTINCPKCAADITDTWEGADYSVGINPGWYCEACDIGYGEHELSDSEPLSDDVPIGGSTREPSERLGTPMSKISTQPGTKGYDEWLRISRSWGYD